VLTAKVRSVDGQWRALDATMVYRDQRALGSMYQAALRAELTGRLGVKWGPVVKGQAEISGIPEPLMEAFSMRAQQARERLAEKLAAFVRERGREPSTRELSILGRDAARESRPAKARGENADRLRGNWLAAAEARGFGGQAIATMVLRAGGRILFGEQQRWNYPPLRGERPAGDGPVDDELATGALGPLKRVDRCGRSLTSSGRSPPGSRPRMAAARGRRCDEWKRSRRGLLWSAASIWRLRKPEGWRCTRCVSPGYSVTPRRRCLSRSSRC
jgi:TrwC relaxase